MKKVLTFLTLFVFALSVKGQKLQKPIIDKITGDTTIRTADERIFSSLSWTGGESSMLTAAISKRKGATVLTFHLEVVNGARSSVMSIDEGSKTYIKFADGSVLTLEHKLSQISDNKIVSTGLSSSGTRGDIYPIFILSDDDINKLKSNPISVIRIETSSVNKDFEIKEKFANTISKELKLFDDIKR